MPASSPYCTLTLNPTKLSGTVSVNVLVGTKGSQGRVIIIVSSRQAAARLVRILSTVPMLLTAKNAVSNGMVSPAMAPRQQTPFSIRTEP